MELREIETFLVLAEELHFGRTAERLYISPSRVSQIIRTLEERIGGRLVARTPRTVRLTPLGERLRDGLRPAYADLHRAIATVRDDATGVTGELRLGTCSHSAAGPQITTIIGRFEERHPGCRVSFSERPWMEGLDDLRRGELDLLISWLPTGHPEWTVGPVLTRQQRLLAVHDGHPLAERGYATAEDLADYALIDVPGAPEVQLETLIPSRTPGGRTVRRRYPARRPADALILVARDLVVHPTTPTTAAHYRYPGVTYIPLRGLPPIESALVWQAAQETAATRAFAKTVEEVVGTRQLRNERNETHRR